MRRDAAKEDYLRTLGINLLRIPNGLVLEDPESFVGKVREAISGRPRNDPSPVPLRLVKAPAAGPPLPKGEGSLSN
jgi:hypothetical protein